MEAYLDSHAMLLASFVIFFFFAGAVVLVLWIMLPFSVFGTKGLVREVRAEQRETNRLLRAILEQSSLARDKEKPETSEDKGGSAATPYDPG
ncbi:MAG: hypothetical protein ACE5EI_03655 [Thermodesulfobacteriota bacterium]